MDSFFSASLAHLGFDLVKQCGGKVGGRVVVVDAEWSSDVFRMDEYFYHAGGQWRRSAGRAAEHRAELGQRVFRVIGPLA